ncbi:MAG: ABC transporter substrate-binding protein [Dehalobacterium sp.]
MYKKLSVLLIIVLMASLALSACGTKEPAEEQTEQTEALSPKHGGILRNAYFAPTNMDPAFYSTVPDEHIGRQYYDFLVFVDEKCQPDETRSLAEDWTADEEGKVWTFNLRQGVKFHDGKEFTSRDVKFTFDRLRDPNVGAATVGMYSNITDISTPDDYTVVFTLQNSNPDFLKDLNDYHAVIVDADNTDFATNYNGTGPFMVESYIPEDRITFVRNPNYWMKDEEGLPLPYLDGMEFIFLSDPSAQVEALRSGQVDYLFYLPAEAVPTLKDNPDVVIHESPSSLSYVIRMRSDRAPANDVRVRQALKLGTDRNAILQGAIEGLGVTGRDTPVSPSYGEFYLDVPEPERDVEKAKQLLAEAGYPNGLTITLHTQEASPVPAIATIWKEQMAEIGVTVDIQLVPSEVYYGAENMWLEVDFAITDWGSRAYPQPYLDLAYVSTAQWNESHWSDPELDELAALAAKEMDPAERARLYHEIQKIFIERGPVIVPFFKNNMWAASANLKGLKPTSYQGTALDLRTVYFEKK